MAEVLAEVFLQVLAVVLVGDWRWRVCWRRCLRELTVVLVGCGQAILGGVCPNTPMLKMRFKMSRVAIELFILFELRLRDQDQLIKSTPR